MFRNNLFFSLILFFGVAGVAGVAAAGEWSVSLFPLRDTLGNPGSFGPSNQFNSVFLSLIHI